MPAELWNALSRNIAPGRTRRDDQRIEVPLERFLASRNWLGQILQTYECGIEFDASVSELLARGDTERREVADRLVSTPRLVEDLDANLRVTRFRRTLKTFQRRDLSHVLALSHAANFSVPGAGKTSVALACYEVLRETLGLKRLLVVAPLSAFESWINEAQVCLEPAPVVQRFDGRRIAWDTEVLLVNYQRLAPHYDVLSAWVAEHPCHVILDEAHRMKRGRNGEWGSACLDLAHLARRRDVLTGTPAPQHPTDLIALLEFLWPHQSSVVIPRSALNVNPDDLSMQQLSRRLQPFFVRTKKDELGLEDPLLHIEHVDMKPVQREIYEALRTRMRRVVVSSARERATLAHLGEVFVYLLQAATNPSLLRKAIDQSEASRFSWPPAPALPGTSLAELISSYSEHEIPAKFDKLVVMIAQNVSLGRKTLVWSNSVGTLRQLREHVLAPYAPALVYGDVPAVSQDALITTRETELRRFRNDDDCCVLLANPAAMSEGVSLHETCHDAIYVDRTFNAGQYLQSVDRIHRLGLDPGTETRVTILVARETIDESVDERVGAKSLRLGQMLSDDGLVTLALPDEEAYGEWIDVSDAPSLLAHLEFA